MMPLRKLHNPSVRPSGHAIRLSNCGGYPGAAMIICSNIEGSKMPSHNGAVIAHLDNITKTYAGSPVAKEAASLRRLLASANPDRETVQRHLQSFAEAAAKAGQSGTTKKMKTVSKGRKTASKAKPAVKSGMRKRRQRNYQTAIFKCRSDYQECCRDGDWKVCAFLGAICIAKQLQQLAWAGTAVGVATKYFSGH
jgi:hypothetical protein